jgi:hypothetical protein
MLAPGPHQLINRLRTFLGHESLGVRLRALVLLAVGWLLSPFCWWNDLVINLPLAWGLGRLLQIWNPSLFTPGLVIGYWISNVAGILLMQASALEVLRPAAAPRNSRRELLIGLVTSTAWTALIVLLVKLGIVPTPMTELAAAGAGSGAG